MLSFVISRLTSLSVLQPLDAGIIQSLKALSRKFEVLLLLDLMKDSSIHASDLAKKTDSSGRNQVHGKILGPSYGRDNPEMFCQMRFCCPSNSTGGHDQILEQEEELASLAERIRVDESKLVIEEHLPQFDVQEEENLIAQLVGEFIDVCSEDEVEEISTEVDGSKPIQQPTVISITQAQEMVTDLIAFAFAKAKSLFSEELELLNLKATIKSLHLSYF
ncbi:hypothetical protein BASA62_006647 [Batrachochytrium salamandrivorans]|nr:hypothetical protein BASA62_006647 [Batrachochytrium salamandrivorans]